MGNSMSHRFNSPQPSGLTVIIHDSVSFNSSFIVFPPLIALQILYSAPGELWNWKYPKPRDLATNTIGAHEEILIPTIPDEITSSEEYTCVVSTKDGYPKMTHFYGDTVVDCHPIIRSTTAVVPGGDNHRREPSDGHHSEECANGCYNCTENKGVNGTFMHK
ncbi:hypothetical protein QVD17_11023 [Tagetes erecta]|uniref:Uncharacterized protein n=1 Tax=Tagetes erecta TaxID=13708 RepID=A0AAD8L2A8_TARER|nr:hypothetical protein QVD17_11023 [Tagetes erecta]